METHEMQAHEMKVHEMQAHEMQTHEMKVHEMQVHRMQVYEPHIYWAPVFPVKWPIVTPSSLWPDCFLCAILGFHLLHKSVDSYFITLAISFSLAHTLTSETQAPYRTLYLSFYWLSAINSVPSYSIIRLLNSLSWATTLKEGVFLRWLVCESVMLL